MFNAVKNTYLAVYFIFSLMFWYSYITYEKG